MLNTTRLPFRILAFGCDRLTSSGVCQSAALAIASHASNFCDFGLSPLQHQELTRIQGLTI